jgi:phosphatidylserine/phosphatidylglycerophosphate/cardiolipin synthase-like enzyme
VLGSANWSRHGLDVNHELDVATSDSDAVAAYAARFEADWAAAAP